jgi:2-polyprenyl-3-methyl-5-hydroxy-6-metoxy-1,4-benzoquinol methylase
VSDPWNCKDAKRWSDHVGTYGDAFQQRYIKSFVMSCLLADLNSAMHLNSVFPRFLHRIMETPIELLAEEMTWKMIAAEFVGGPIDLSQHLIVDLGCGEGIVERFLGSLGATCVGLDYSGTLITEARRKQDDSPNLLYEIVDFRKDFKLLQLIERFVAPKSIDDFESLVVLSINTLDHLADPTPLMAQVRALCRLRTDATFVISTLNPTFYLKMGSPLRIPAAEFTKQAPFDVHLTMSRATTHIFPRGWGSYSEFFSSAGFDTEYFFATDLDDFPENETIPVSPDCPRAGGPFLFWRLIPVNGRTISEEELEKLLSSLALFSNIDPKTSTTLRANLKSLVVRNFKPDELVAMPGGICRGLSIVTRGTFVVTIDKAIVQDFGPSTAFGDLESCSGFYAGRYLYEVRAGATGGECLDIPTAVLYTLLTGSQRGHQSDLLMPTSTSIGDRLFLSMRDRFNAHNPFYHRSIEVRPSQHPSRRVNSSRHFINNRQFSLRDVEHLIRCLVTLVTVQEEKFTGLESSDTRRSDDAHRAPGLAVFVNPKDIKIWLSGREPGAKERPFASELAVLHKLGLIDAFSIPQIDDGKNQLRNMITAVFDQLVNAAVNMIVARKFALVKNETPNERLLTDIILPNHIDQLVTSQIVRNLNSEAIKLTASCTRAMNESRRALELLFGHKRLHEAQEIAISYYYNIAFLKWALFARDERRLIVIRDYQFFRRVTGGGLQWIEELEARLELRDRMVKGSRDWSHLARVENYLKYVSAYVLGHWRQGWDLDYSGPRSRKPEGSWRALILLE